MKKFKYYLPCMLMFLGGGNCSFVAINISDHNYFSAIWTGIVVLWCVITGLAEFNKSRDN